MGKSLVLAEKPSVARDQASLPKATIFLEKTKNGDKRQVPISSELAKGLW